jgi:hypothetical protein
MLWSCLVVFLYVLAAYVLQLTKTIVLSKIFAILCLNVFIISMKKYFVWLLKQQDIKTGKTRNLHVFKATFPQYPTFINDIHS